MSDAIVDPLVVEVCNGHVRRAAKFLRDLKPVLDDVDLRYAGIEAALTPTDAIIVDGREAQGERQCTAAEWAAAMTTLRAVRTALEAAGAIDALRRVCACGVDLPAGV